MHLFTVQNSGLSDQESQNTDNYLDSSSPDHHLHHPTGMTSVAYSQPSVLPPSSMSAKAPPYSVNGLSLAQSNMDLMHPAMGYPSGKLIVRNCVLSLYLLYCFNLIELSEIFLHIGANVVHV